MKINVKDSYLVVPWAEGEWAPGR